MARGRRRRRLCVRLAVVPLVLLLSLLLLRELLLLVWEVLRMSVHELGVRHVVGQRYGAVAALFLSAVVVSMRAAIAAVAAVALTAVASLAGWRAGLVWVWGRRRREVVRWRRPAGHGGNGSEESRRPSRG